MRSQLPTISNLLQFLNQSPTQFHAAACIVDGLKAQGFQQLNETDAWHLEPEGRYFIQRNSSAVIAWKTGKRLQAPIPYHLALSHLDSPGLRLKMRSLTVSGNNLVAPVEKYSSNIDTTWLDHPLTVAGRAVTKDGEERLLAFPEPIAVIPNVAIHLQRDVNRGIQLNPQTQLSALMGQLTPQECIDAIANQAGCTADKLAEVELSLVDATPATVLGLKQDLINAPRLDNLLAAHAMLVAMEEQTQPQDTIPVAFFADNEEIGSNTWTGADSNFLKGTLSRINLALQGSVEDDYRALAGSKLLSIDAAHAFHPNYPEKYDRTTAPLMNAGIALKANPNGRYITAAPSAAWFERLCEEVQIAWQHFSTRADMSCGSTVGPTTAARLGLPGVDVGSPMWAMHSVRETAGLTDHQNMIRLLKHYLN